ncbi:MAG TPA: kelch repeat-containing protein, partial [Candidatus Polarisedimenticolia bacterium]|nr:kelch repeat-containing protein [Candidatus Polarisedimenticolia bacterium]
MELERHSLLSPLLRWLVGSLTALSLTLPALEGFGATPLDAAKDQGQHRSLSFADRVAAQKAIEEVLWRHRIWPKENPGPKPALEKVLPDSAIREKVTGYLKKSKALEKFWSRPLTAAQLQAEMERMAKNTRQPGVLREIFTALHDDPFLIAECLARPALADRLLHNTYSTDALIHRAVRDRAERDLARFGSPGQMRAMQGDYREKTWIRGESDSPEGLFEPDHVSPARFDALVEGLRERLLTPSDDPALPSGELPMGKVGPLREAEDSFRVAAILSRSADSIRIASVTWSKTPFEVWWKQAKDSLSGSVSLPAGAYDSVSLESAGCTDDTWRPTGESTPAARIGNTTVWTGTEMIVWGGDTASGTTRSGSRYNPATDTWASTFNDNNSAHVPPARSRHVAVWTGSKMIIWSG